VTVATLRKHTDGERGKAKVDPQIPESILARTIPAK
jgi:hypothetical protein